MTLEQAKITCPNYYSVVEHAKKILPAGTDENTARQTAWLYIQYGCNTYTDGPGFPFRPGDVRDALPVTREEGIALAERLLSLGILERTVTDRLRFSSQWI